MCKNSVNCLTLECAYIIKGGAGSSLTPLKDKTTSFTAIVRADGTPLIIKIDLY